MEEKNIAVCPNCGGDIRFKKVPFIGQVVVCRFCHTDLTVSEKSPVELDWADYDDEQGAWEDEYETNG